MNPSLEESRSGSDMPESSMQRHPVMIICDLPEGTMKQLQQIFMEQTNPRVLRMDHSQDTLGDNLGVHLTVPPQEGEGVKGRPTTLLTGLPLNVVKDFQDCLSRNYISGSVSMVKQHPAQLFLQTCALKFSRSALHVAVLESSHPLFRALSEKLDDEERSQKKDLKSDMIEFKSDVQDFILKVDEFGLSAIDMVALTGNDKIFLNYFKHKFAWPRPNDVACLFPRSTLFKSEKIKLLEMASLLLDKQAPTSSDAGTRQICLRDWLVEMRLDFLYCLHEALGGRLQAAVEKFVNHVFDNGDSLFLEPLFNVRDEVGRSPLHIFYNKFDEDGDPGVIPLLNRLVVCFPNLDWNMPDFNGRTPLHWATVQGYVDLVRFLVNQEKTNLNAVYGSLFDRLKTKKSSNFSNDPVVNMTPLHLAVIHNYVEVVEALLEVPHKRGLAINALCERKVQFLDETLKAKYIWEWTPFQLAAYMGHERILQVFLKDPRLYDPGLKNGKESTYKGHKMIPALHLATSKFHPIAVKALVDSRQMNIFVKDAKGNTALHYAAMHALGLLHVHSILYDYVSVSHFTSKPPKARKPSDHDIITCIDILMQSGLDMDQRNNDGVMPTLHSSCPEKVQTWWLQKMAREAQENKNNLITAANAISVTAALVATASFVGPLQPPLGLLDDSNQTWLDGFSQVKHTSVQVFLFCDSLSFYLAIAAIVFAMLPSWPIPHEGLTQEVRIARRCVQVAVILLFGSIIFVICAFSAASIAIVPNQ